MEHKCNFQWQFFLWWYNTTYSVSEMIHLLSSNVLKMHHPGMETCPSYITAVAWTSQPVSGTKTETKIQTPKVFLIFWFILAACPIVDLSLSPSPSSSSSHRCIHQMHTQTHKQPGCHLWVLWSHAVVWLSQPHHGVCCWGEKPALGRSYLDRLKNPRPAVYISKHTAPLMVPALCPCLSLLPHIHIHLSLSV